MKFPLFMIIPLRLILVSFMGWCSLSGQTLLQNNVDWQNSSLADTTRLQLLDSLIQEVYWTKSTDTVLVVIQLQDSLAKAWNSAEWKFRALQNNAELHFRNRTYHLAIPAYQKLLNTLNGSLDYKALTIAYRKSAYSLRKTGQIPLALIHYEQSLSFADKMGNDGLSYRAATLNSIGSLYLNRKDYAQAESYYQESLELHLEIDKLRGVSSNYNNLSIVYYQQKNYTKALATLAESLKIKKTLEDEEGIANVYGIYGNIYLDLGQLKEAENFHRQSLRLRQTLGLSGDIADSFTQLGRVALAKNEPEKAVDFCNQGCLLADDLQLWEAQYNCHECLYFAHKVLNNKGAALLHLEILTVVKDSIFNGETAREITLLEANYKYENELVQSEAEQLQLKNKATQERLLRWFLLCALFAFVILAYMAFRIGWLRQQKNQELQEKNQLITTEREIIKQQKVQLQEVAKIKNRFFGNVSHELRTPLTLVVGPLEKLLKDQASQFTAGVGTTLQLVNRNARKLLSLVEELLELSRLETGTAKVYKHNIQAQPFFLQLFDNFSELARQKGIDYRFSNETDANLIINSDPQRLERIVDNLLNNALKFTPSDGIVQMKIRTAPTKPDSLIVIVSDTGPGIASKDLPQIFERYFQVPSSSDPEQQGNGIGLALAQESALLLQGIINVDSQEKQGSTFTLTLPAVVVANEKPPFNTTAIKTLPPATTQFTERILIVEDNLELQQFVYEILATYDCTTAANGQEALQLMQQARIQQKPFKLVITDLMMPEMDGFDFVNSIKTAPQFSRTRLIVLTAHHNLANRLYFLRIGVDDYLTKPFVVEELVARVNNLLSNSLDQNLEAKEFEESTSQEQNWLQELEAATAHLLETRKDISADLIAHALNMSNRQLLRKLRATTGLSTQEYLQESKLQLARRYLEQERFSTMAELARSCGFNTPSYFSNLYLNRFGVRPTTRLN